MTSSSKKLDVVVVGAGIVGLAAALGLAREGHCVNVLEAGEELSELGAGIQIPPNAARILYSWGLGEVVERHATVSPKVNIRRFSTGEIIGCLKSDIRQTFGYQNMTIHRADFQKLLYDEAVTHGVKTTFGSTVTFEDVRAPQDSKFDVIKKADLVVAADGISSPIRKGLFPSDEHQPRLTGDTASRVILPCDRLVSDTKLAGLVKDATNNMWMGPKRHVVAYTIRGLELYNVVLCGPGEAPVGVYNEPCSPQELREEYSDFDGLVGGILAKANTAHRWLISEIGPLPAWTAFDGRLVLLGDAAHAMMPYAAQGAAQGLEDAAVLAACLADLGPDAASSSSFSRSDLKRRLQVYERLRKPRAERVVEVAHGNRFLYGLEDGPEQRERDQRFAKTMDPPKEADANEKQKELAKAEPDAQARFGTPEFSQWLYGHDAVEEARIELRRLK